MGIRMGKIPMGMGQTLSLWESDWIPILLSVGMGRNLNPMGIIPIGHCSRIDVFMGSFPVALGHLLTL